MKRLIFCSALLAALAPVQAQILTPDASTKISYEDIGDAALWFRAGATQPWLLSTQEGDGLSLYSADGEQLVQRDAHEAIAVDLRYQVPLGDEKIDLAAVADPDENKVWLYRLSAAAPYLTEVGELALDHSPEGLCLYQNIYSGQLLVNSYAETGQVSQYRLRAKGQRFESLLRDGGVAQPVRRFDIGGGLSGCVADDETGELYVIEQNLGVWRYGADPENVKERSLLAATEPFGELKEIEGIDLLYTDADNLLIVGDEDRGYLAYNTEGTLLGEFQLEGFDEAKQFVLGERSWFANTGLDNPLYQRIDGATVLAALNIDAAISNARSLSAVGAVQVLAQGETEAVDDDGDAADDSAIWVHPTRPERSLIIATNKQGGLMAYNLDGKQLQYLESGEPNNVDIRWLGDTAVAVASNRELNSLAFYRISDSKKPIEPLPVVGDMAIEQQLHSDLDEVYGLCMYQSDSGDYAFVNGKSGQVEQYRFELNNDHIEAQRVRTFSVPSQPEGCVADDANGQLYLGEEDAAIWRFDAEPTGSTNGEIVARVDGERLTDDIEGLALYHSAEHQWLLASSQGDNSYAVFDIAADLAYVGSFRVGENTEAGVDGTSDTDGIAVTSAALGRDYPQGVLVVQDWYNIDADFQRENQNFKLVNMTAVIDALAR